MKPIKTREETLADLAARSSEGKTAAKRFEILVRRVVRTPTQAVKAAKDTAATK